MIVAGKQWPRVPNNQEVRTIVCLSGQRSATSRSPASFELPYTEMGDTGSDSTYGERFVPSNTKSVEICTIQAPARPAAAATFPAPVAFVACVLAGDASAPSTSVHPGAVDDDVRRGVADRALRCRGVSDVDIFAGQADGFVAGGLDRTDKILAEHPGRACNQQSHRRQG